MRRHARGLAVGGLLGLGIWLLAVPAGRSADKDNPAKGDIIKLADEIGKGDSGAKGAAGIHKKLGEDGLGDVMHLFKPRPKGGIGVGAAPGGITPDGIEFKIQAMSKRALPAASLAKNKAALQKMADQIQAISEVTKLYVPKEKKAGKDPANWKKYAGEMEKGSKDLRDAIKGGNAGQAKKAATDINAACNNCHSEFRD